MVIPGLDILPRTEVAKLLGEFWKYAEPYEVIGISGGDFKALFLHLEDGIFEGHWWGTNARDSLRKIKQCLNALAKEYPGCTVRGMTPVTDLKALKMARLFGTQPVGFKKDRVGVLHLCTEWKEN